MIYKYNNFIENISESLGGRNAIYYSSQFESILGKEISDLGSIRSTQGYYGLYFSTKDTEKKYFLLDSKGNFIVEDDFKYLKEFKKMYYDEFWKDPYKYINNFKFDPKFLGDLNEIRNASKYNL
jgi:hypothetical protein